MVINSTNDRINICNGKQTKDTSMPNRKNISLPGKHVPDNRYDNMDPVPVNNGEAIHIFTEGSNRGGGLLQEVEVLGEVVSVRKSFVSGKK